MKIITTTYKEQVKNTDLREMELMEGAGGMQSVMVYPELEYQTFLGFGGAFTEASGYAWSKLSEENRKKALELYFSREGNGYRLMRSHIDSCDFSLGVYSAMDDPEDTRMESFSLAREEEYLFPLMRAARETAGGEFDLMLTPWSPPAFMKTNSKKTEGGKLRPEYRRQWAEYICRYIEEYEKKGFPVSRLTIQNEPAAVQSWDSCIYTAQEEKEFLRDYLYPVLQEKGLSHIKLNIWDHNKERLYERARDIIDKDTDSMVDGVAFHWYSGDHFDTVRLTGEAYPGKELIFTEGCVEYSRFGTDQLKNAQMYAHDIIGNLNAGMTGFIDWNIFLDEKGGPNHVGNYCDAPVMVDTRTGELDVKLSFDYIGHFSKYIRPGARRIGFTNYTDRLEMTAFKNSDQSIVLVMMNRNSQVLPVTFELGDRIFRQVLPEQSIVTAIIEG
ncbi:glucosylceramidase [Anaerotaenia torta]|uniref:glycoside hydrolase family 30 protein n=1 Tax=Anaerotaenia torta TaxID=433293 RepID=UPI003D206658